MREPKVQRCFNCGEEIGIFTAYRGDILTCGKRECEREANQQMAIENDEAQERAREDDYGAYR